MIQNQKYPIYKLKYYFKNYTKEKSSITRENKKRKGKLIKKNIKV